MRPDEVCRRFNRTLLVAAVVWAALPVATGFAQSTVPTPVQKSGKTNVLDSIFGLKQEKNGGGWLFVASRGEGEGGVYLAISQDGYHWSFVNDGQPAVRQTEKGELMSDPFIQRGPDGIVRMVWTWSKDGAPAGIGYSSSYDLLHWAQHRKLVLTASIPGALTARAPAMYYDAGKKDWVILWTSSVLPNAAAAPEQRIYATTTTDFKQFAPAKLFFDPGYDVADATVVTVSASAQQYELLFQDGRANQERIYAAKGTALDGPWQVTGGAISDAWAEAPAALPVEGGLLVYYHHFHDPQEYGAAFTKDLQNWSDVSLKTSFPGGMRHGSFLRITSDEYQMLKDYYFRVTNGLEK
jgi:hypothetical protein